ncbi:hypothetical protein ABK040_000954 [Willaertia magna]
MSWMYDLPEVFFRTVHNKEKNTTIQGIPLYMGGMIKIQIENFKTLPSSSTNSNNNYLNNLNNLNHLQQFNIEKEFTHLSKNLLKTHQKKIILYIKDCNGYQFNFSEFKFHRIIFENCFFCNMLIGDLLGGIEFYNCNYNNFNFMKNTINNLTISIEKCKFCSIIEHKYLSTLQNFRIMASSCIGLKFLCKLEEKEKLFKNLDIVNLNSELNNNELEDKYISIVLDDVLEGRLMEINLNHLKRLMTEVNFHKKFLSPSAIEFLGDISIVTSDDY